MYVKYTIKPWRGRSRKTPHKPRQVTNTSQIVSMDQLASPTPGLVAQMTGILTTKGYKYATVFVDHFYRYSYMKIPLKEKILWKYGSLTWHHHQAIPLLKLNFQSKWLGPRLPRACQSTANNICCCWCSPQQLTICYKNQGHPGQWKIYDALQPI